MSRLAGTKRAWSRAARAGATRAAVAAVAVAAAVAIVAAPATASAYVRYLTSTGNPYSWRVPSVTITAYPVAMADLTVDQVVNAAVQATVVWTKRDPMLASCTYFDIAVETKPTTAIAPDVKYDHTNNMVFRTTEWESLCSMGNDGSTTCHDASALALTTVFSRSCGEIVDADIEVNAFDYTWTDTTMDPGRGLQDLQNALAHESGHFIGLDHTCYNGDPNKAPPLDENGVPIPFCGDGAPAGVKETTMYASADPGDITKRTLAPDDQAGLCAIYPLGTKPVTCGDGSKSGCSVAPGEEPREAPRHTRWLVAAVLLSIAGLAALRRRRSG